MGHKERLGLGQIAYILVFYNISFSWLLLLDGFQFIILVASQLLSVCRISLTISFLIGRKRTVNFRNPRLQDRFWKYLGHKHPLWLPEAFTKHNKKFDLKLFSHHVKPERIKVKNRSNYANQANIMEGSRDKRQTAISGQRTVPKSKWRRQAWRKKTGMNSTSESFSCERLVQVPHQTISEKLSGRSKD